jgi:pilus assembly protein FimV
MKARFTALLPALLLAFSSNLFAVGLGELKLESALNEPLRARIALLKTGDLSEGEIQVKLAPAEDFVSHNISRDYLDTKIHFQVDLANKAGPSVILTTSESIKEPSMDFLVQLEWPKGKLVRGYTILLEKP